MALTRQGRPRPRHSLSPRLRPRLRLSDCGSTGLGSTCVAMKSSRLATCDPVLGVVEMMTPARQAWPARRTFSPRRSRTHRWTSASPPANQQERLRWHGSRTPGRPDSNSGVAPLQRVPPRHDGPVRTPGRPRHQAASWTSQGGQTGTPTRQVAGRRRRPISRWRRG